MLVRGRARGALDADTRRRLTARVRAALGARMATLGRPDAARRIVALALALAAASGGAAGSGRVAAPV